MLNNLKKKLESEKKDNSIFDIIIYGSFVKGKTEARDLDILVIFNEGTLRDRLDKIQSIKHKLKKINGKEIDIKQAMIKDIFSPEFMARTGILLEGISVFRNKSFSESIGFKASTLFWYTLEGLTHTQKVKFNYTLAGRGMKGLLEELDAEKLSKGAIKVPIQNSITMGEILKNNKVKYKKKNILEEI